MFLQITDNKSQFILVIFSDFSIELQQLDREY